MAHYWLPDATSGTGTGNWSATGATGHWADDAVGTNLGKAAPGIGDSVYFGANAFNGAGQVVTVNATANCLSMDWTGATNTPTLAHSAVIFIYGTYTGIAAMVHTGVSIMSFEADSGNFSHTWGTTLSCNAGISKRAAGTAVHTFFDDLNIGTRQFALRTQTLNTNGKTITCEEFFTSYTSTRVLTPGASVFNCTSWTATDTAGLTITANTATINCSGNAALGNADYNGATLVLTGATSTVSGSPTGLAAFNLTPGTTQAITGSDGTITAVSFALSGSAGHIHTISHLKFVSPVGSITKVDYADLSNVEVSGGKWIYGKNCTFGAGNTGWTSYKELMGSGSKLAFD